MCATVALDPVRQAVINACIENWDVGDAEAEWPNNLISRHTVVYNDGTIARRNEAVMHEVDADELSLCIRLSQEAEKLMDGVEIGMGSNATTYFAPFSIAVPQEVCTSQETCTSQGSSSPQGATAPPQSIPPKRIDEAHIRAAFGGTLFPLAIIRVEPFAEDTKWWCEIMADGHESGPAYFLPWKQLGDWFTKQSALIDRAFVSIGDDTELNAIPQSSWPSGTELTGCVLPRLALGLTEKGSLVGLFGYTVRS